MFGTLLVVVPRNLFLSESKYVEMANFVSSYKDFDGSPINPRTQQDTNEFFNILLDRVENALKLTPQVFVCCMHLLFIVASWWSVFSASSILFLEFSPTIPSLWWQPHIFLDMFGGKVSNQIICKGLDYMSSREESFYSISLEVKNQQNLKEVGEGGVVPVCGILSSS